MLESELFGFEKGSFTGSINERKGLFEMANNGTIFLDDIDDFPVNLQVKLLRVLESREIKRIGAQNSIPLDIRLITSSKIDLNDLVLQDKFRLDLFFRINVLPIKIPALRERCDDIPLLVKYFLNLFVPEKEIEVSDKVIEVLKSYWWPGNVRELRNIVQRVVLFTNGKITVENLPDEILSKQHIRNIFMKCVSCQINTNMNFEKIMTCTELHLIENALVFTKGNKTLAARMLGLSLSTFRDKLRKHNICFPTGALRESASYCRNSATNQ
ncbi:MAG: sigma-54-dependent Fis family transcriptional regulator [Ignavibacteria bacterium]|nr:sigma-54-dependent Fis family transcriptional regulator [Ignavibacteria bacterium]